MTVCSRNSNSDPDILSGLETIVTVGASPELSLATGGDQKITAPFWLPVLTGWVMSSGQVMTGGMLSAFEVKAKVIHLEIWSIMWEALIEIKSRVSPYVTCNLVEWRDSTQFWLLWFNIMALESSTLITCPFKYTKKVEYTVPFKAWPAPLVEIYLPRCCTTTLNRHTALLPDGSVNVYVTGVVPTLKVPPELWVWKSVGCTPVLSSQRRQTLRNRRSQLPGGTAPTTRGLVVPIQQPTFKRFGIATISQ